MNVNELKLGNLVYAKTEMGLTELAEVRMIQDVFISVDTLNGKSYMAKQFDGVLNGVEPIPLTVDRLILHDFKKSEMDLIPEVTIYEKEVDGKLIELSMFDDGNWYAHIDDEWRSTIGGCFVSSMHELQNICALCGIEKVFKSC